MVDTAALSILRGVTSDSKLSADVAARVVVSVSIGKSKV